MFTPHPTFIQPDNENIRIWRYMDFTKLVSLIDTGRLFFSRCDKFEDPFEGSWPKLNVEARNFIPDDIPEKDRIQFVKAMTGMGSINKNWPRYVAANCWHANDHESAAMWKIYLKSEEGIAIQSTYHRFKSSIIDPENVFIGKVTYIDYDTDAIDATNMLSPFVHKRKSFEHEKEIRGLIIKWPSSADELDFTLETIQHGIPIQIDIETLVDKIHIAPNAPSWLTVLIQNVIKKYGYRFDVIQSQMNTDPLY